MKAERRYSCAIFALWSLVVSVGAYSGEIAHPMPTSGQCSVPADPKWTMAEKFVWQYVCIGEIANFNEGQKWGGDLDPKKGLPESRILSSTFLETILFADNYRHALTPRGVRIIGARFAQTLDLESTELEHDVWLAKSLFEEGVNFRRLKSTHVVLLTGSRVTRELNLEGLQVDQQLIINNAEFEAVDLKEAHIGGEVNLMGSVAGALDEDGLKVDQGLLMGGNAQFGEVVLRGAHIGGQVNLSGSKVIDKLDMNGLNVDQSLFMSDGAEFKDVDLGYAHVGGSVDLSGSKVTGTLDMEALKVGNDLRMSEAEPGDVHLTGAHVSGSLSMDGSKVTGTLEMEALEVDLELFMRSKAEFGKKVDLSVAHVGGQVTLEGSRVAGTLQMNGLKVDKNLFMINDDFGDVQLLAAHIGGLVALKGSKVAGMLLMEELEAGSTIFLSDGAEFDGPINLVSGKFGGSVELAGGAFKNTVDLTGAQIGGELRLGSSQQNSAHWTGDSSLILRNAKADAIQDLSDSWPARLDLNGFSYRSQGGSFAAEKDPMIERPIDWFKSWLGRQKPYTPAPYEQLATVLRNTGNPEFATDILYAGKEREREQSRSLRYIGLTASKWVIGYGYHLFLSIYWALGFLIIGTIVLWVSNEGRRISRHYNLFYGLAYSFDLLLPIIRLREKHYQVDLHGWARYYFYVHRIMGYVLASFLIAGISGLTK